MKTTKSKKSKKAQSARTAASKAPIIIIIALLVCAVACVLIMNSCKAAPECEHEFSAMKAEVAPTCTDAGVVAHKSCTLCGANFDADGNVLKSLAIAALGGSHSYTDNYDVTCDKCGAINPVVSITSSDDKTVIKFADGKKIEIDLSVSEAKCTHSESFAKIHTITPHTPDSDGLYLKECTAAGCPDPFELFNSRTHVFGEVQIIVADGKNRCEDGYAEQKTCLECGYTVSKTFSANPDEGEDGQHTVSANKWIIEEDPGHMTDGKKVGTCEVCGKNDVIAPIPGYHDYKYTLALADTTITSISYEKRNDEISFIFTKECKVNGCNVSDSKIVETVTSKSENIKKTTYLASTCYASGIDTYEYIDADGNVLATVSVTIDMCAHVRNWTNYKGEAQEFYYQIGEQYLTSDCPAFTSDITGLNCKTPVATTLTCDMCKQNIPVNVKDVHKYDYELKVDLDADGKITGASITAPEGCKTEGCTEAFTPVTVADLENILVAVAAPTCVKEGMTTYSYVYKFDDGCLHYELNLSVGIVIDKIAHTLNGKNMDPNTVYVFEETPGLKLFDGQTLTCDKAYNVYFNCDSCKQSVIAQARLAHTVLEWEEKIAPGCETTGKESGTCAFSYCKALVEREIAPKGHVFEYKYNVDKAELEVNCKGCDTADYMLTEVTKTVTEATCKNTGKIVYTGTKKAASANEEDETVTVTEVIAKKACAEPAADKNNAGTAYLYNSNLFTLFAGETINSGETKDAYYECPECGARTLVKVFRP